MSPATGGEEGRQSHHKNDVGDEKTSQLEINRSIRQQQIGVTSCDCHATKTSRIKQHGELTEAAFNEHK
ncbi:hypothetical protein ACK31Z_18895 [Aeromonas dhakensis]|uniref:hypothetical protein n=1 Tax=Aeromonas dhakensis TaxID=196024 RepID=UPI00398671E3